MAVGKSDYIDVIVMPQSVGKVRAYWREDYNSVENYSTITITDVQGYLSHKACWATVDLKFDIDGTVFHNSSGSWMFSANADGELRSVVPTSQWDGTFTPFTSAPIYHNDDGTKTVTLTFTLVDCYNIHEVGFDAANNRFGSESRT